eukprot:4772922-Amphidinium_carterae.3
MYSQRPAVGDEDVVPAAAPDPGAPAWAPAPELCAPVGAPALHEEKDQAVDVQALLAATVAEIGRKRSRAWKTWKDEGE